MNSFPAITHVAVTVTDLARSVEWYRRFLGSEPVLDEHRAGLDHVAFGCADRAELERWQARLDELGIPHGGIVGAHYGSGLSFRDPDNIALEFFAPPG